MSALQTLQDDFQDYVLGDGAVAPAMAAAVRAQPGLGVAARLAIYHNAYRARMREALAEAYDKTWSYVGDDMFADLAAGYLAAHPSHFRNLRWFGGDFAAHAALALPDYPFIAELARFEWSLGLAFDAADVAPLLAADFGALAPHEWGELTVGLHPSLHMLELHWNAVALWQALDAEGEPPEAERAPGAVCWLVWRHAGQPHFRSLDALEADALRGIGRGASFGAVCAAAADGADGADVTDVADVTLRLAGYLRAWLAQGVLIAPLAPSSN